MNNQENLVDAQIELFRSIKKNLDQLTATLQRQMMAEAKEQTNADWIRSMTDEEIGIVLSDSWPCNFNCDEGECDTFDGDCRACCLAFLKAKRGTTGRELNPDAEA